MRKLNILTLVALAVLLAVSLGFNVWQYNQSKPAAAAAPVSELSKQIKSDRFQALFLTNGQVYFGHLSLVDESNYKLTDTYYLSQQVNITTSTADLSNVKITKLGAETHRPENAMVIPREQVLFFENLQDAAQFGGALK